VGRDRARRGASRGAPAAPGRRALGRRGRGGDARPSLRPPGRGGGARRLAPLALRADRPPPDAAHGRGLEPRGDRRLPRRVRGRPRPDGRPPGGLAPGPRAPAARGRTRGPRGGRMTSSGGPAERVGPYRLLERLGAGGMGEVFLAQDERLDRQVALKRIRALGGVSAEKRERFRREARLAARLNHPAIVQIYDVLTEGADEILVLEYVEGTTLRHLVNAGPLAPGRAAAIGRDVAQGLSEAHRHGIVHRDLKSENVLVTPDGRAKIADFGIAKRPLEGEDLTATGLVMGTSRSMAPEQARGEPADFRSDLFS